MLGLIPVNGWRIGLKGLQTARNSENQTKQNIASFRSLELGTNRPMPVLLLSHFPLTAWVKHGLSTADPKMWQLVPPSQQGLPAAHCCTSLTLTTQVPRI